MTKVSMRGQRTVAPQAREPEAVAPALATDAPEIDLSALPDVAVTKGTFNREECWLVKFGKPERSVQVVDLDLGQQFDLAEITGGNAANLQWMNMAYIAASVRTIDNDPIIGEITKPRLRATLKQLGVDGMKIVGLVLAGYRGKGAAAERTEDQHRAAVKN